VLAIENDLQLSATAAEMQAIRIRIAERGHGVKPPGQRRSAIS
jgi:hypothetical protein